MVAAFFCAEPNSARNRKETVENRMHRKLHNRSHTDIDVKCRAVVEQSNSILNPSLNACNIVLLREIGTTCKEPDKTFLLSPLKVELISI